MGNTRKALIDKVISSMTLLVEQRATSADVEIAREVLEDLKVYRAKQIRYVSNPEVRKKLRRNIQRWRQRHPARAAAFSKKALYRWRRENPIKWRRMHRDGQRLRTANKRKQQLLKLQQQLTQHANNTRTAN